MLTRDSRGVKPPAAPPARAERGCLPAVHALKPGAIYLHL